MEQRIRIPVENGGEADLVVVVEPWASEICLSSGEKGEVVFIGYTQLPTFGVELCAYGLIFYAHVGADSFELWKNGELWD